jgi:hypothetical protein
MPKASSHNLRTVHCHFVITALYSGKQNCSVLHRYKAVTFILYVSTAHLRLWTVTVTRTLFLSAVHSTINLKTFVRGKQCQGFTVTSFLRLASHSVSTIQNINLRLRNSRILNHASKWQVQYFDNINLCFTLR